MTEKLIVRKARRAVRAAPSQARLIEAAERLFSERGIDSVSMREIAIAARCGDNNAVQYNFGSKDGLLSAIFAARVAEMDPLRLRMLGDAERAGLAANPTALAAILCLPHLSLSDGDGRHPYAGFLIQFATRYWSPVSPLTAITNAKPGLARLMEHLRALLAGLDRELASGRIMLGNLMFQSMLIRWDHSEPDQRAVPLAPRVRDTLSAVAATLAPPDAGVMPPELVTEWLADVA
jgi:AcrR family transcriptional regulator